MKKEEKWTDKRIEVKKKKKDGSRGRARQLPITNDSTYIHTHTALGIYSADRVDREKLLNHAIPRCAWVVY
jgi:hypothetical protein